MRREAAVFNRVKALSHIPKLIQLLNHRRKQAEGDDKEYNFWTYRLGVTLQDLAQLKVEIRNPEDAMLHLQESEKLLRGVKAEEEKIGAVLLRATIDRNHDLFKDAQAEQEKKIEEANKPKVDYEQLQKAAKRRETTIEIAMAAAAFTIGFVGCKMLLDRHSS